MNNIYFILILCFPFCVFCQITWNDQDSIKISCTIESNQEAPIDDYNGNWKSYYKNGQIKTNANYIYGQLNGVFASYYENGLLKSEGHYKNNKRKGFWKFFYENGGIKQKSNYRYGKLRGHFRSFYQNGQIESEGNFIDIEEKRGIWKYYYDSGQLQEEHIYKDGTLISKKWFNKEGNGPFQISEERLSKYIPLARPMQWIK